MTTPPKHGDLTGPSWYEEELVPATYNDMYEMFKGFLEATEVPAHNKKICSHLATAIVSIGDADCSGFCGQYLRDMKLNPSHCEKPQAMLLLTILIRACFDKFAEGYYPQRSLIVVNGIKMPSITQHHVAVCCESMLNLLHQVRESGTLADTIVKIDVARWNSKWARLSRNNIEGTMEWKLAKEDIEFFTSIIEKGQAISIPTFEIRGEVRALSESTKKAMKDHIVGAFWKSKAAFTNS